MNFSFGRRLTGWLAVAFTAGALTACAEGARPDNMTIAPTAAPAISQSSPNYKTFRVVHVDGGSKTNPLWMSAVSSEDFQKALENSLKAEGLLADDPSSAKTEITANLQELQRPPIGLDFTVTSKVRYTAKSVAADKVVFDDVVAASGTAKFGDSLLAVQRLQMANEASMKENIKAFIDRLLKTLNQTETASN